MLKPGDDVHEVKDKTGSVLVACTDRVLEWLERKSTAVKGRLCSGMGDLLLSVGRWMSADAAETDGTRTPCSPTTRPSAGRGRQRARRV